MNILEIYNVSESYQLPDAIMRALLSNDRVKILQSKEVFESARMSDYFQSDAGDREKLKQDFTPKELCDLVARLMKQGDFLDMCAGTGGLTEAAVKAGHAVVYAQEFSQRTIPFLLLNAAINEWSGRIDEADCLRGDIQKSYRIIPDGGVSRVQEEEKRRCDIKYDNVIMNPPYSMPFKDAEEYSMYGLKLPTAKADLCFLLRGLEKIKDEGRLIAILPHGVLFRGKKEENIRKWLIEEKIIKAVIGLPEKLFLNTGIPVFLLVLERNSDRVLFVDASKGYTAVGKQNILSKEHTDRIEEIFNNPRNVDKYASVVTIEEMRGNDYNLNIPRYVDTFEAEELPDMFSVLRQYMETLQEEEKTCRDLASMMLQMTGNVNDMMVVAEHVRCLKKEEQVVRKIRKEIAGQLTLFDD